MPHQPTLGKTHAHRDDLPGEHPLGDAGQLLLAGLFAAVWIADTFFFKHTTFLNQYVSSWVRVLPGLILMALSGYLAMAGLSIVFGEEQANPGVIKQGVFKVVRHPVYLSEILLYLGLLLISISLAAAGVWVAAIGFLHYISCYEEKLLLARFGEEYECYMREVPMWLPRFRRPGAI